MYAARESSVVRLKARIYPRRSGMRSPVRSLTLLAAAAAFGLSGTACQAAGKGIVWQKDLKKAQAQAAKQKKILMVDFSAPW